MARGGVRGKAGKGSGGIDDSMSISAAIDGTVERGGRARESLDIAGRYTAELVGRDGVVKWREEFDNLVTTVGKNSLLDVALGGSAYTAACYIGLISSASYGAGPAVGDTMGSHAGWYEAGASYAPTWDTVNGSAGTNIRAACTWSGATGGQKALSSNVSFVFSGTGTVKGCFLAFNGATNGSSSPTVGTLVSAGTFADKTVGDGDTLNVSYSLSIG